MFIQHKLKIEVYCTSMKPCARQLWFGAQPDALQCLGSMGRTRH